MTSNGTKGANFERRVRAELVAAGYEVIRSAASKTGIDLVALPKPSLRGTSSALLVQVKLDGRLDPGEWNELVALAQSSLTIPVLASLDRSARPYRVIFRRLTGRKKPRSRTFPFVPLELLAPEETG